MSQYDEDFDPKRRDSLSRLLSLVGGAVGVAALAGCKEEGAPAEEDLLSVSAASQALSGTVGATQYADTIGTSAVPGDLRGLNPGSQRWIAVVNGAAALNDGGGGVFYWDATSLVADDGGTIIQATGVATGRWRRIYDGPLNVLWFGAGTTTLSARTAAIKAAFAAAGSATNRAVYFPAGSYDIDDEITLLDGITVTGEGWSSQIHQTFREKNVFISGSGCEFRALHLIGLGDTGTPASAFNKSNGIYAEGKRGITIASCFIEKCEAGGVKFTGCRDVAVLNNRFFANPCPSDSFSGSAADIVLWSGSDSGAARILIQGNFCLSNNSQGIYVDALGGDSEVVVSNNICVTLDPATCTLTGTWSEQPSATMVRRHGIIIGYGSNPSGPRCVVEGNLCRNTLWTGIYKTGSSHGPILISDNVCSLNGWTSGNSLSGGIYVNQSGNEEVIGNYIMDYQNPGGLTGGITVNAAVVPTLATTVAYNTVRASKGAGIMLGASCARVQVKDNVLLENQGADISWAPNGGITNVGGFVITGNRIVRIVVKDAQENPIAVSAIVLDYQASTLITVIRDNDITGWGWTTATSVPQNAAIHLRGNRDIVQAVGNRCENFYYGVSWSAYWAGRQSNVVLERNVLQSCAVGFGIGTQTAGTVVPLIDNVFPGTPSKVDNAQLGGGVAGYVCKREGDRLVIEAASAPVGSGWIQGDRVHFTAPVAGGSLGAVCVSAGPPAVWKSFGSIAP